MLVTLTAGLPTTELIGFLLVGVVPVLVAELSALRPMVAKVYSCLDVNLLSPELSPFLCSEPVVPLLLPVTDH